MEKILGPFSPRLLRCCSSSEVRRYFNDKGGVRFPECCKNPRQSESVLRGTKTLEKLVHRDDSCFLDLLKGMLRLDPRERMTAEEAYDHPFFFKIRKQTAAQVVPQPEYIRAGPRGRGGGVVEVNVTLG